MRLSKLTIILLALLGTIPAIATAQAPSRPKHRVVYLDDGQSLYEAPLENPEKFIREFISREVDSFPITTFSYLVALPDICYHDSKVGEVFGQRKGLSLRNMQKNSGKVIRKLRENNTDVLKIAIEVMRSKGIEILAEVRMNDTHHRDHRSHNPLSSVFAQKNPQYVLKQPDGRKNETALDYSYPEVRAHRMAIMRELAEDYDIDGLELNLIRWAKHFPRDQAQHKAHIMTAYVGEIRKMLDAAAKKRGRGRLTLGVIVPEGLRECRLAGLDPETWVKKGWIDILTIGTWNETDPQIDVAQFARFTKGTNCELLVNIGNMMGGVWRGPPKISERGTAQFRDNYSGMLLTPAEARACAANYFAYGADGLSLWNISCNMGKLGKFSSPQQRHRMVDWIAAVATPQKVQAGPRRYHYLPIWKWPGSTNKNYPYSGENQSALGTLKTQILQFTDQSIGKPQTYRFRMADGRNGEKLSGTLALRIYHIGLDDKVALHINGKTVDPAKIRRKELDEKKTGLPGVRFEIDLANCPAFRGNNELGITLKNKRERKQVPYMEELDILVE